MGEFVEASFCMLPPKVGLNPENADFPSPFEVRNAVTVLKVSDAKPAIRKAPDLYPRLVSDKRAPKRVCAALPQCPNMFILRWVGFVA